MRADQHRYVSRPGKRRSSAVPGRGAPVAPRSHVQHLLDRPTHCLDVRGTIRGGMLGERGQRVRTESKLVTQREVH
jgi:hypothetical protein